MLKNRVLASFGALFACGAAVAVYLENYIPLFLFLVAGVLCGYLCIARLLRRKPRIRRTLAYAAAPLLAIAFTFVYRALFITPYYALDGAAVKGAGTVVEVREYAAGGYLEVEIEEADTPLAEGLTVRLYLADGANLPACGFTVEFEATLRVPENGTGMAADRVLLVGTQAKLRSVWYPSGALWKLRYAVSKDIEEMYGQFGKEVPAVIKATVVNNTTGLTDDVYAAFRDTGTAHLIAISGQHFSILIMSIYGVLCALGMGRKPRSLVCSVLAILYAAFVGFTPSVVRAAIMLLIVFLVFLSMREPDGLSSLFFALIVLLVLNPYSIASVSLQLSFLSCLGILLVGPLMNDFFSLRFGVGYRLLEFLVTPIVYSVVAALFTFPVSLTVFDTVSIISPLANLLSGALFTLLLVLALISVALYPLLGSAAVIVYYPCGCLAKVILAMIDWLATLPFASMPSSAPHLWPAMLAAVLSIAALIAVPSYAIRQTWIRQNARTMSMGRTMAASRTSAPLSEWVLTTRTHLLPPLHPLTPRRWIRSSCRLRTLRRHRLHRRGRSVAGWSRIRSRCISGWRHSTPCPYRTIRLNRESGACTLPSRHPRHLSRSSCFQRKKRRRHLRPPS